MNKNIIFLRLWLDYTPIRAYEWEREAVKPNRNQTKPMTTSFKQFKTVSLPDTSSDEIGFFEAIAIAGLEKQYIRIPVAIQRKHFGYAPFGKLAVRVENGVCRTIKCMAYGNDYDYAEAFWSMADKAWRSSFDCSLLAFFPRI